MSVKYGFISTADSQQASRQGQREVAYSSLQHYHPVLFLTAISNCNNASGSPTNKPHKPKTARLNSKNTAIMVCKAHEGAGRLPLPNLGYRTSVY